jgi:dipeptidyl aminopeptidase/acylaminoacyl peptidase
MKIKVLLFLFILVFLIQLALPGCKKSATDPDDNEIDHYKGKIAFMSTPVGKWEVYIMNGDGSNQTRLTQSESHDWYPVFTPDGSKIAFESHRDGNSEIYIMDSDGSNQFRLTNNESDD